MMDKILTVAKSDTRIRAVSMEGSRANASSPVDIYMDYDISYYVADIEPFYNNPLWVIEKFGEPLIMQMPQAMRCPDEGRHFNYMMIYPDSSRLDLTFKPEKHVDDGEPYVILLDKDDGAGFVPTFSRTTDEAFHIKPPTALEYYSCCNNFWWCLNNVAKGIARDELSYVMFMLNSIVREELHFMMSWHIGVKHGFDLSVGKEGKYFKLYMDAEHYERYKVTYSCADYEHIWASVNEMCDLFHDLAIKVGLAFGFTYRQYEEDGIRQYFKIISK